MVKPDLSGNCDWVVGSRRGLAKMYNDVGNRVWDSCKQYSHFEVSKRPANRLQCQVCKSSSFVVLFSHGYIVLSVGSLAWNETSAILEVFLFSYPCCWLVIWCFATHTGSQVWQPTTVVGRPRRRVTHHRERPSTSRAAVYCRALSLSPSEV